MARAVAAAAIALVAASAASADYAPTRVVSMRLDGHEMRVVGNGDFAGLSDAPSPVPSPDRKTLAFYRRVPGTGRFDIFLMNLTTGAVRRLTRTPLPRGRAVGVSIAPGVTWSPHGKRLAFAADPLDLGDPLVYAINRDGTHLREIGFGGEPSWSPDGKWIVVTTGFAWDTAPPTLAVMKMNDASYRHVLWDSDVGAVSAPRWSADSRRIAFVAASPGRGYSIETVNADGSGRKVIAQIGRSTYGAAAPAWSPRRAALAYVARDGIHVWYLGRQRRIAQCLNDCDGLSWSPDGAMLAWRDEPGLVVTRADGRHLRAFDDLFAGAGPWWSADGKRVLFGS